MVFSEQCLSAEFRFSVGPDMNLQHQDLSERSSIMLDAVPVQSAKLAIRDRSPKLAPDDRMLEFFLSTLDVRAKAIAPRIAGDKAKEDLWIELKDKLASVYKFVSSDEMWNEAYRLERLLVVIEPADSLFIELIRRTNAAIDEGIPASTRLKNALDKATTELLDASQPRRLRPDAEIQARMLLLDALEETHRAYRRKYLARPMQKKATSRIVTIGGVAVVCFLLPYLFLYVDYFETGDYFYCVMN